MKKHLTKTEEQNAIELRRSSRNTAVNKLSTSRRRPKTAPSQTEIQALNCSTSKLQEKQQKKDIVLISPIKKQLPTIAESPSYQNEKDSSTVGRDKSTTTPSATPKNNKTRSFVDSTPFKEDLLACSQHFDPQSDVAWDCRSPDAINFLKRGRRRRHYSDVSEIVTQLQISKDEFHEETPDSTTPQLLGLWMNDGSYFNHQKPTEQKCKRERRRRDKTKSSKGNDSLSKALLEKLQLVMEKCEENEEHAKESTEKREHRRRSASVGDESKDLFDITSTCKESDNWSDDELFEDDSFIIKATQMESQTKSYKRKIDGSISDEPPVKSGKYCQSSGSKSNYVGVTVSRFTRLNSKPSPFKKHKSFNDRDEYQKPHMNEANYVVQSNIKQTIDYKQKPSAKSNQFTTDYSKQRNVPCTVVSAKSSFASSKPFLPSRQNNALKSNSSTVNNNMSNTNRSSMNSTTDRSYGAKTTFNYSASKSSFGQGPKSLVNLNSGKTVPNLSRQSIPNTSNVSKNNSVCNAQSSRTATPSATTIGSQRLSGVFDTSLSDDILCQLVEPDEILDSQIPISSSNKSTDHIDEALSFLHDNPKSDSVISKKRVQTNNSLDTNKCVRHNNSKTLYSENVKNTYKKNMAGPQKTNIPRQYGANLPSQNVNYINTELAPDKKVCLNMSSYPVKKEKNLHENKNYSSEQDKRKVSSNTVSVNYKCSKPYDFQVNQDQKCESFSKISVKKEPSEVPAAKAYSFKSKSPRNKPTTPSTRGGYAIENASEDLFMSDDDDLSEPQLLAMLDTVESTQMNSARNTTHVQKTEHRSYCWTEDDKGKQKQTNNSDVDMKLENSSPLKCSQEEIRNKKQEAMKRLQKKSGNIFQHTNSDNLCKEGDMKFSKIPNKKPIESSPLKCSPEVEKKQQEAINRKQCRTSNNQSQKETSPFKCSSDDIERKKQEAIRRKKLHFEKNT